MLNTSKRTEAQEAELGEHILLKVRAERGLTITAHADMIAKRGTALFGKIGKGIGQDFRNILNQQIEQGIKTYLFLTVQNNWRGPFTTYQCLLRQVQMLFDVTKRSLIPRYYVYNKAIISTWFEIASIEQLMEVETNKIFVLKSGREIMSVVNTSGTVFRVGIKK
jgi:hypothetical protein